MPTDQTAVGLIASVRRQGKWPSGALTDAQILAFLNDEMQTNIVPVLMRVNEEYFVANHDFSTVIGTEAYAIPSRSIGNKTREVLREVDGAWVPLLHLTPEQAPPYENTSNGQGTPLAYYVRMSSIVLVPSPDALESIRIRYYRRPNDLTTSEFDEVVTLATAGYATVTFAGSASTHGELAGGVIDGNQVSVAASGNATATAALWASAVNADAAVNELVYATAASGVVSLELLTPATPIVIEGSSSVYATMSASMDGPLTALISGVTVTATFPDGSPGEDAADALAQAINASEDLAALGVVATTDGLDVPIIRFSETPITASVTGGSLWNFSSVVVRSTTIRSGITVADSAIFGANASTATIDIIKQTTPFDSVGDDLTATVTTSGNYLRGGTLFESVDAELVAVGDYACISGMSPVPQIPRESVPVLTLGAVAAAQEAEGDPKAGATRGRVNAMRDEMITMLAPRARGNPITVSNPNAMLFTRQRWWAVYGG